MQQRHQSGPRDQKNSQANWKRELALYKGELRTKIKTLNTQTLITATDRNRARQTETRIHEKDSTKLEMAAT